MAGLTAYQYLFDHVRLERDKTVLVNCAAGGVGHVLVRFAKTKNAHVIGVASGRHAAFLRDLGVDRFIDYTTTAVEEPVCDVDHLIDTVGWPHGHRFLPVVKRGGTISPVFYGEYHRERAAELGIAFKSGHVHSDGPQMAELARLIDADTRNAFTSERGQRQRVCVTGRGSHRDELLDAQMVGDSKRVGHPAADGAARLHGRQAIARPVYADDTKPRGFGTRSQVRRLDSAARTAVAPQHRGSRRTAVIDKSHRMAVGEQNRLILHTFLPSIRPGHRSPSSGRS